jgi:virginiamycin B lyase
VSLAGSHVGAIKAETGAVLIIEPPTPNQGARRIWSDSKGRLWVSEWNSGQVSVYDPETLKWQAWKLPGSRPQTYAVYVDERDKVWLSDFGGNAIVMFDPETEQFTSFPLPSRNGSVRQLLGRPGELWGAESSVDKLIVIRYDTTK